MVVASCCFTLLHFYIGKVIASSRIALAIPARDIATAIRVVRDDLRRRNDVARGERRPKPVNDLGCGREAPAVLPGVRCFRR
jgi:hypothetical protein